MNSISGWLTRSPITARVAPFAVFVVLTFLQNHVGPSGHFWLYSAKTLVAGWMLWTVRAVIPEMGWKLSWEALLVGIAVFVMWIGLGDFLTQLGFTNHFWRLSLGTGAWNPHAQFGAGTALAWLFILVRIVGVTLVVPPMEEVFFRSFVYRYLTKQDFLSVPLGAFVWMPFVVTSALFGFEHLEWLAGLLCGLAYQGLVCWKGRLGDAVTAHAVTNLLLGLWVAWKGAWQFW